MNYLICGTDSFLVNVELDKIKKIYDKETVDVSQYDASEGNLQGLLDEANMPCLFADYRFIVVNQPLFLTAGGKLDDQLQELLIAYLKDPNPMTILVFVLQQALDTRKSIVKTIRKLCDCRILTEISYQDLQRQVTADCKKYKIQMDQLAMNELMSRLSLSYDNWQQQLLKLRNYDDVITVDVVKGLVLGPLFGTGKDDALLFTNAILAKNMNTCFRMWKDLCITNKEPYSLIGLVASQFRFMYQVKYLQVKHLSSKDIADYLHANEYRVKKTIDTLSKYQLQDILEILNALADLDFKIKSGVIDAKNGFELFLLKVTRRDHQWSR